MTGMSQAVTEPVVTVVIPAYKRLGQLEAAVRSVMAQNLPPEQFEIVVVDSSPDDSNPQMVERLCAESPCSLRCLRKKAEGPGPSRNLGALSGRGALLAFMDSDCEASPAWLQHGIAAFSSDAIGLVQGRTMPDPSVPHSIFSLSVQVEEESFLYETANIFYRREAFEAAGGFLHDSRPNSEKPLGGEDVDLAWKIKRAGWKSVFASDALVFHEVVRISKVRWFVNHRLILCPKIVHDYPELRQFLVYGYFYEKMQVWTVLALAGLALCHYSLWTLLLLVPYAIARGSEGSRTLKGPMRLLRILLYAPRDFASFITLAIGSVRYRALVL